jgi:hypothetical protein
MAHEDDQITIAEAAEVLAVPEEQVRTMIDQGLLDRSGGDVETPTFLRGAVEAVRAQGG